MSTHLHFDSRWRDRSNPENTNPAEFTISPEIAMGWNTTNRTVQAVRPHDKYQVTNIVHSIKLLRMTIPYSASYIEDTPFLYVQLSSFSNTPDKKLIHTLENGKIINKTPPLLTAPPTGYTKVTTRLSEATFVVHFDKTQGTGPEWIQFKSDMTQTYRLDLKNGMKFRVFTPDGITIPITDATYPADITPAKQVEALFEVTPYVREDRYDNHYATLYNKNA